MPSIVLLLSADGNTETRVDLADMPLRINLPDGAVVETRDEMSGQWQPFVPHGHKHHRFTDFSLLD